MAPRERARICLRRHVRRFWTATRTPRFLGLSLALGCIACDSKPKTPTERGAGIFARSCSGCHGFDGSGVQRPGLTIKPRDLTDPAFQSKMSDEGLKDAIRMGKGQMPPFERLLDPHELDALVLHIRTLKPVKPR